MIEVGVDYYPEHWERKLWESDIARMQKAGVRVVRIAEFAWSRLEPEEGKFDFGWLDEIVALLKSAGMKIILGTPTNCAPLWLYRSRSETLQTERTGCKTETGIRGHRCQTSPVFRKYAGRIVSEMARRYANDPAVVAWQIDNEIESNHCNCEHCTEQFRAFLRGKYGDIGALNRAYGNDVWSGDFSSFEEIRTPLGDKYRYGWLNPSFMLDYERFAAASTSDYIRFQSEILREANPAAVITTNGCFGEHTPDYYRVFADLDVAAYDNYPTLYRSEKNPNAKQAFVLDLVRGYKRKNFWVMEQMSGSFGCWGPISPAPRPGAIKGYAMQAVAHGADLVMHFRWRTSTKGAEMFCHGILDHSNADNRRLAEVSDLCAKLNDLAIPESAVIESGVALLYSYEQEYAFKVQEMAEGFTYRRQAEALHAAYRAYGVNIDVIEQSADISKYKIVVVPTHFVTDESLVSRLETFVRGGGIAIITNRSGVKDRCNACLMQELPGPFARLCGVAVAEYDAIGGANVALLGENGKRYTASCWCDVLSLRGARAYARYSSEYYAGEPAASVNAFGKGAAYYIGAVCSEDFYEDLAAETLQKAGIECRKLPADVEKTVRENAEERYVFFFNNGEEERALQYGGNTVKLRPYEAAVFKERK